jgi:eukaryotic translation initiation factor 2C
MSGSRDYHRGEDRGHRGDYRGDYRGERDRDRGDRPRDRGDDYGRRPRDSDPRERHRDRDDRSDRRGGGDRRDDRDRDRDRGGYNRDRDRDRDRGGYRRDEPPRSHHRDDRDRGRDRDRDRGRDRDREYGREPEEPVPPMDHDAPGIMTVHDTDLLPEETQEQTEEIVRLRPNRPDVGTVGRPIKVVTNWYKVEYGCDGVDTFYQFDVNVKKLVVAREGKAQEEGEGAPKRRKREAGTAVPALLCRHGMAELSKKLQWPTGLWAYDGKANLYSPNPDLVGEGVEEEVEMVLPGEVRPVKLSISVRRVASLATTLISEMLQGRGDVTAHHHVLQALDVAFKHRVATMAVTRPDVMALGRAFLRYDPASTPRNTLGGGAQVWLGYKQALRPCQSGLALTVDTAAGAVFDAGDPNSERGKLLSDLIYDVLAGGGGGGFGGGRGGGFGGGRGGGRGGGFGGRGGGFGGGRDPPPRPRSITPDQIRQLNRAFKGFKIKAAHNGFKRTVVGFANETPFEARFVDGEGKEVTVAEYMERQYPGTRVTDRVLPCVRIGNGKALLPPELCVVISKQKVGGLSGDQTAAMIRIAAQKPQEKMRDIEDRAKSAKKDGKDELKAFGLKMGDVATTVTARILPPPTLRYGGRDSGFNPQGSGAWNLRGIQFLDPKSFTSWAVVSFCERPNEVRGLMSFLDAFCTGLSRCGLRPPTTPPPIVDAPGRRLSIEHALDFAAQQAKTKFGVPADFILVVLPDTKADRYKEVKQVGDTMLGIPTQCIVSSKAKIGQDGARGQDQYIANVALKINAKLGGSNVALSASALDANPGLKHLQEILSKPYMVFGIDVTHPPVGSTGPSVAAMVGSLDSSATRYAARLSVQTGKKPGARSTDILVDFKNVAKELLLEFYKATRGKRPERIFIYRDGVSEGEFERALIHEYTAMRAACAEMGDPSAEYAPPITFLAVQKRHQTRLFAADPRETDKSGNLPPGVVVDTGITHPTNYDFFLNAHSGLQGTNRPIHYTVLIDENGMGPDAMQQFSYWLSYIFCRCTRSISVPAPSRYAHLAAFRGRALVRGDGFSDVGSVASGGSGGRGLPDYLKVHDNLNASMFFV